MFILNKCKILEIEDKYKSYLCLFDNVNNIVQNFFSD